LEARIRVAREAARLIYNGTVKEYKDAKEMAAGSLGVGQMSSNFEVAEELDRLADEREGGERRKLLMGMREAALSVMGVLEAYDPRLIGSVWRGTARGGSDIDIVVYHCSPQEVEERLSDDYQVQAREDERFYVEGLPRHAAHIKLALDGFEAEVVVRPPEEREGERCEIYGDVKRGLSLRELEKLMRSDPLRRFVPKRRIR